MSFGVQDLDDPDQGDIVWSIWPIKGFDDVVQWIDLQWFDKRTGETYTHRVPAEVVEAMWVMLP